MILQRRAVGTFPNYETTEMAMRELEKNGFVMDRASVVGRDLNDHPELTSVNSSSQTVGIDTFHNHDNKAAETASDGAIAGGTIGGFTGLLVGLGALAIPGVGPVMLAGAAATAIATTISGGVIGAAAGSLVGGLVGLGIPDERAQIYSDRISQGDCFVIVEGTDSDIALAESIFSKHHIQNWYVYDVPNETLQNVTTSSTYSHLRV